MASITVRNPVALTATPNDPPAKRPPSLDGLTLGLWWNEKPGGEVALEHAGARFAERFDVALHERYQNFPAPTENIDEAALKADVVIGATGD
ncbi:MAG: hypothetical protein KY469_14385 [Actinobacteria bacterium]|nr:hypothetical protein [Actinomycetota bacterium]